MTTSVIKNEKTFSIKKCIGSTFVPLNLFALWLISNELAILMFIITKKISTLASYIFSTKQRNI
jgi:hypothetical protein